MDLLFWYIDLHQNSDVRLAFEALKVTLQLFTASTAVTCNDIITMFVQSSNLLQSSGFKSGELGVHS